MKIWAKVRFRNYENSEYLIRRFFEEANSESSLSVHGRIALIEYIDDAKSFRGIPQELIKAISKCEVLEFRFGREMEDFAVPPEFEGGLFDKLLEVSVRDTETETSSAEDGTIEEEDKCEEQTTTEESVPQEEPVASEDLECQKGGKDQEEQVIQTESFEEEKVSDIVQEQNVSAEPVEEVSDDSEKVPDEIPDDSEQASDGIKSNSGKEKKSRKQTKRTNKKVEACQMNELQSLAKQAQSFSEFIDKVIAFVGLEKKCQIFRKIILVASKLELVSWENIEEAFIANGDMLTSWDKISCSKLIKRKFQSDPRKITILKLVNSINLYKDYDFNQTSAVTPEVQKELSTSNQAYRDNLSVVDEYEVTDEERSQEPKEPKLTLATFEECPVDEIPEVSKNDFLRIQCFPRNEDFEQGMKQMPTGESVENQLKYLLKLMGVNREDDATQKTILDFTHQMITCPETEFDFVFKNIAISGGVTVKRMVCADFINQFAKRCGATELVSLERFCREIRVFFKSTAINSTSPEE